jgi:hypothetical protein
MGNIYQEAMKVRIWLEEANGIILNLFKLFDVISVFHNDHGGEETFYCLAKHEDKTFRRHIRHNPTDTAVTDRIMEQGHNGVQALSPEDFNDFLSGLSSAGDGYYKKIF